MSFRSIPSLGGVALALFLSALPVVAQSQPIELTLERAVEMAMDDSYQVRRVQSFERQEDTARNFLEAYIGFRNAMLSLQRMTYFDFEKQVPVLDRYGVQSAGPD